MGVRCVRRDAETFDWPRVLRHSQHSASDPRGHLIVRSHWRLPVGLRTHTHTHTHLTGFWSTSRARPNCLIGSSIYGDWECTVGNPSISSVTSCFCTYVIPLVEPRTTYHPPKRAGYDYALEVNFGAFPGLRCLTHTHTHRCITRPHACISLYTLYFLDANAYMCTRVDTQMPTSFRYPLVSHTCNDSHVLSLVGSSLNHPSKCHDNQSPMILDRARFLSSSCVPKTIGALVLNPSWDW